MKLKKDLAVAVIDAIAAFEDDTGDLFDVASVTVTPDRVGVSAWNVEITCTNRHGIESVGKFVGGVDHVGAVWVEKE